MLPPKKILILEDEPDVALLYQKSVTTKGYECKAVTNGRDGLAILNDFNPDLIMLDLNMPGMSGVEFYERICGPDGNPRYPVLVLSGRADLQGVFKDLNVSGFIVKPFPRERLLSEIEIIIQHEHYRPKLTGGKRVIIIDEDQTTAVKIAAAFNAAGCTTDIAASGTEGIQKIMADPYDLAMIHLGLSDIPGDLVIFRLHYMEKTRLVHCLLFLEKNYERHEVIMDRISDKSGVKMVVEYRDPIELVRAADDVLKQLEDRDK